MAGLTRNSGAVSRSMPVFPKFDTTLLPYFTADQSEGAYVHLPGFAGGTAGRSIRILQNSLTAFGATMYNIDGTTVSAGGWGSSGSAMTIATAAGSSNADRFVGAYMDSADAMFYMLFTDTSTSPHTLYFSKINEAGTVTAIGNAQLGNAGMGNLWGSADYTGVLRRLGGDGSGNFGYLIGKVAGGNSASAVPYRGVDVTINASNGSLSYSQIMPNTYGSFAPPDSLEFGPTSSGIIAGVYSHTIYSVGRDNNAMYGALLNTNTGTHIHRGLLGGPNINAFPFGSDAGGDPVIYRSRSKYIFSYYNGYSYGPQIFDEDEVHNWVDEMAMYYGIL